jgi:uncharacterized protein (TIGR03067 family)
MHPIAVWMAALGLAGQAAGQVQSEPDAAATEADAALKGVWIFQRAERQGVPASDAPQSSVWLTFDRGAYRVQSAGEDTRGVYRIDPTRSPKHLDMIPNNGQSTRPAVYEVRGDELRICQSRAGVRPNGFATGADQNLDLLVFRRKAAVDPKRVPDWMKPLVVDGVMVAPAWAAVTPVRLRDEAGTISIPESGLEGRLLTVALRIQNLTDKPVAYKGWQVDGWARPWELGVMIDAGGAAVLMEDRAATWGRAHLLEGGRRVPGQIRETTTIGPGRTRYDFLTFIAPTPVKPPGPDAALVLSLDGATVGARGPFVVRFPVGVLEHAFGPDYVGRPGSAPRFLDSVYFLEDLFRASEGRSRFEAWEAELAAVASGGAPRAVAEAAARDAAKETAKRRAAAQEAVRAWEEKAAAERAKEAEVKARSAEEETRADQRRKRAIAEAAERMEKEEAEAADRKATAEAKRDEAEDVALLEIVGTGAKARAKLRQVPGTKIVYLRAGEAFANGKWRVLRVDAGAGRVTIRDPQGTTRVLSTAGGKGR